MLRSRAVRAIFVIALLAPQGCGSGDDDSLNGVWTGGFKDSLGGLGGGNLTLNESGVALQGSWEAVFQTFAGREKYNNSGSVTGTAAGDAISLIMTSQGPCPYKLDATRTGRKLSGTYSAMNCDTPQTGSVDLEKR